MSLYKRPGSKYYWMKFTFDGELIQRSTKCKARRDAETVESAYRTQLALRKVGIVPKKKAIHFKQASDEYLAVMKVKYAPKPMTYQRDYFAVKTLLRFFNKMVDQIDHADGERFVVRRSKEISKRTGETITNDTINRELTVCRKILNRLVSDGTLAENPLKEVDLLPPNKKSFHVLTRDEENRYLMACEQPLQDVATVMLESGVRPKELYRLTRNRVNLARACLQVTDGKTKASNRTVWLTEKAVTVLRQRMKAFSGLYLFPKGGIDGAEPLRDLNLLHHKAQAEMGQKDFRLYDCRHTFATRAVENGVDLLTLAAILGHANLKELQRYAHPSENFKREAVMSLERATKATR